MRRVDMVIIVAIVILIAATVSAMIYLSRPGPLSHLSTQNATIAGQEFKLYVPISSEAQTKGLGGIEALQDDEGMLFYMPETDHPSIWMKDMLISIDAIWLDNNRRVVHTEQDISPDTYPQAFRNPAGTSAQYVLELQAGQIQNLGIGLDDEMVLRGPVLDFLRY